MRLIYFYIILNFLSLIYSFKENENIKGETYSSADSLKNLSDDVVLEKVKYALERSPIITRFTIDVSVIEDTVFLSGIVDTYIEKQHAQDIVSGVIGVKNVVNKLFYRKSEISGELELKQNIEMQLFWNPEIESHKIIVEVVDSTAILSGTVSDLTEINEAESETRKAGAKEVINKLKIKRVPDE